LKESGRLKESPVPVRVPSPNFTIAEIIDRYVSKSAREKKEDN
jgi:hypothetical protein